VLATWHHPIRRPVKKLFALAIILVALVGAATGLAATIGGGAKPDKLTGYPTIIKGPYVGLPAVTYKYIALPVTHHIVLLVWLEPKFKHNTFVYNLKNHISSVVTWDQKGDPSLGSVTIIRAGSHPIVATRRQARKWPCSRL
jgi:hypothetical protein